MCSWNAVFSECVFSVHSGEKKDQLHYMQNDLRVWAKMRHPKNCSFNVLWKPMAMMYVGPMKVGPLGSHDAPPGRAALLLYAEYRPLSLIFCVQPSLPILAGEIVHIDLQWSNLMSHVELSRPRS